jgi:uncharacterized metal-binding protein YceD (DUF177 family)
VSGSQAKAPEDLRLDVGALRRRDVAHHRLECDLSAAWLAVVLADTDAQVGEAGRVALDVSLQPEGTVVARGRLTLAFRVPCGRCLEPASVDGTTDILATFVRQGTQERAPQAVGDDEGLGLAQDELDVWAYDGQILPLEQVIGESIKLAYPMRALCARRESCRGLCSSCGAVLNEQALARRCAQCGAELEGIALGDLPEVKDASEGPLAEALRKLDLPD